MTRSPTFRSSIARRPRGRGQAGAGEEADDVLDFREGQHRPVIQRHRAGVAFVAAGMVVMLVMFSVDRSAGCPVAACRRPPSVSSVPAAVYGDRAASGLGHGRSARRCRRRPRPRPCRPCPNRIGVISVAARNSSSGRRRRRTIVSAPVPPSILSSPLPPNRLSEPSLVGRSGCHRPRRRKGCRPLVAGQAVIRPRRHGSCHRPGGPTAVSAEGRGLTVGLNQVAIVKAEASAKTGLWIAASFAEVQVITSPSLTAIIIGQVGVVAGRTDLDHPGLPVSPVRLIDDIGLRDGVNDRSGRIEGRPDRDRLGQDLGSPGPRCFHRWCCNLERGVVVGHLNRLVGALASKTWVPLINRPDVRSGPTSRPRTGEGAPPWHRPRRSGRRPGHPGSNPAPGRPRSCRFDPATNDNVVSGAAI